MKKFTAKFNVKISRISTLSMKTVIHITEKLFYLDMFYAMNSILLTEGTLYIHVYKEFSTTSYKY